MALHDHRGQCHQSVVIKAANGGFFGGDRNDGGCFQAGWDGGQFQGGVNIKYCF